MLQQYSCNDLLDVATIMFATAYLIISHVYVRAVSFAASCIKLHGVIGSSGFTIQLSLGFGLSWLYCKEKNNNHLFSKFGK